MRGAPGPTRTADTRFRKPLLYPLSYGGAEAERSERAGVFARVAVRARPAKAGRPRRHV